MPSALHGMLASAARSADRLCSLACDSTLPSGTANAPGSCLGAMTTIPDLTTARMPMRRGNSRSVGSPVTRRPQPADSDLREGQSDPFDHETNRPTSLRLMALRPDEFYDHALAAANSERRLPLARMTGWEISPFEPEGLRVAPLRPPVLPEPPRQDEDPSDCQTCRARLKLACSAEDGP